MPGTQPKPKPKPAYRWSMNPDLHNDVCQAIVHDQLYFNFHDVDDAHSCIKQYDTNVRGRFVCRNNRCNSTGWFSNKIAITIRMYSGNRYNARVYHQRCQSCNQLSRPSLDESYAERIAYRLKKWSGIHVEPPKYSGESKGPHESSLCEGCKDGHCKEMNGRTDFY